VDRVTGQTGAQTVVEAERSSPVGVGLVRVDGDDLEVGLVVERHECVVGADTGVWTAGRGQYAGGVVDQLDPGLEVARSEDEMVDRCHGPTVPNHPRPNGIPRSRCTRSTRRPVVTLHVVDFTLSPELQALQNRAREVAAEGVANFGRHNDSWINGFSKDFAKRMAEEGWIGMGWPKEHGGQARPPIERVIVAEEMIAAGAPIAAMWFADRQMGPTLIAYGTADQQAEFLPKMLSGETTWCIGMSEPDAGSDLAGLKTSAVRDGDVFVVNGQKIWTSFGEVADYCYLICRTTSDGPPHKGISEIIVPMDTPGIEVRPIQDMTTNRHFCEVYFTDVRVPVENLVGVEGDAFKQTMVQLAHERGGIDRLVSNRALYELALEQADTTDPVLRQEIASLEMGYRVGRLLVYREVMQQAPAGFSAATKAYCTEHETRVADFVARVLGPEATVWNDVTAGLMYAPGYTIMGGTSNVMRNILGERVLGLPREPRI